MGATTIAVKKKANARLAARLGEKADLALTNK
jgi:hypothetical protein